MGLVDSCYKCASFNRCLDFALYNDDIILKCLSYGALKSMTKETIEKLNEIGEKYELTKEEVKELVYCLNRRQGGTYV